MQLKRNIGLACILLGVLCVLIAAGLLLQNAWAEHIAAQASSEALARIVQLAQPTDDTPADATDAAVPADETAAVAGAVYCGVLRIDAISLTLPIQSEFSYPNLKSSPCVYTLEENEAFVIAAHNYAAHFGSLPQLQAGNIVSYTTLDGTVTQYAVTAVTTVEESDLEAVQGAADELILFTCNINNNSQRVVVRCALLAE